MSHLLLNAANSRWPNLRNVTAVLLLALPLLIAADDGLKTQREANRKRIEDMTPQERQQLEENYREFRSLPSAEQQRLVKLHQAVERDPKLKATLEEYQRWASTLSPVQRNELRRTTDPQARMRLIDEWQRQRPPGEMESPFEGFDHSGPPDQMQIVRKILGPIRLFDGVPASSRDADALIRVLEQQLPAERREGLGELDPFTRKVRVVRDTLQRTKTLNAMQRLTGAQDNDVTRKLVEALEEGSPARQFVTVKRGPEQRMAIMGVLIRGLVADLMLTVAEHFPSDAALKQFETSLSKSERDLIDKLPPADRLVQLRLKYLEQRVPGIREFREISLEMQAIFSQLRPNFPFDRIRPNGPMEGFRRPDRAPFPEGERGRPPFDDDERIPPRRGDDERPEKRRFDNRDSKDTRPD